MFNIKNRVFNFLTPRQKSALFSYLKPFVKKHSSLNKQEIIDKFIDNENYYFEIKNPHFEFIAEYLSNDEFIKDLGIFTEEILLELKQKELMAPLIEKRKQFEKEQRKRANDYKMSKLKPTKKQLAFYEKLTRAHNLKMKETGGASRLDLRNWIMEIIDEQK